MSDFGANEWLVEQMFEQWQADPASVDPAWQSVQDANGTCCVTQAEADQRVQDYECPGGPRAASCRRRSCARTECAGSQGR